MKKDEVLVVQLPVDKYKKYLMADWEKITAVIYIGETGVFCTFQEKPELLVGQVCSCHLPVH